MMFWKIHCFFSFDRFGSDERLNRWWVKANVLRPRVRFGLLGLSSPRRLFTPQFFASLSEPPLPSPSCRGCLYDDRMHLRHHCRLVKAWQSPYLPLLFEIRPGGERGIVLPLLSVAEPLPLLSVAEPLPLLNETSRPQYPGLSPGTVCRATFLEKGAGLFVACVATISRNRGRGKRLNLQ